MELRVAHVLSRRLFTAAGMVGAVMASSSCGRKAVQSEEPMQKVTSKDGTLIAFDRAGQGPALILVGGALSERSANAPLVKLLAPSFTVLSYDRRGRGDSGDTAPYAVEREIQDIEALITEAGGSAFVYGKSSGAVLALEATSQLSDRIRKLALYEPPLIVDDGRPPPPPGYAEQLDALIAEGRPGDAIEFFMTKVVGMPAEAVAPMRKAPTWPKMEAMAHTLAYDVAVAGDTMSGNPLPAQRWASATAPTLVMDGGASPEWMRNGATALANVLANAQHRTLPGQTHEVGPEVIAPVLERFFAE
jgi:pimeloyl-ACP methyl ester carboxylesterase